MPEDHKDRRFSLAPFADLWRLRFGRLILTSVFLEGFFVFGGLAYLAASMLERFTFLGATEVGVMLAGYGLGGLCYSATVKRLVPRIGERGICCWGSLLCAAYLVIGLLQTWWLFIPGMILYGMATLRCRVAFRPVPPNSIPRHARPRCRYLPSVLPRPGNRPDRDGTGDQDRRLRPELWGGRHRHFPARLVDSLPAVPLNEGIIGRLFNRGPERPQRGFMERHSKYERAALMSRPGERARRPLAGLPHPARTVH